MRYLVRHCSSYAYTAPVVTSFHRLHISPLTGQGQTVLSHQITVEHPNETGSLSLDAPATVRWRQDHFGNQGAHIELLRPYSSLAVTGWSCLQIDRQPSTGTSAAWDRQPDTKDPAIDEFRWDSLHIRRHPELAAYAAPFFTPGGELLPALDAFNRQIHADCAYDSEATDIATAPLTTLASKRGVCQDFAHLGIACLRSLGLPVAYVSGYLETAPPANQVRLVGADASHAWFAVHDGLLGWIHCDPTNGCLVGDRHVITAVGRDFSDVSPVIGIIYGGGTQQLRVGVDVIPEPEWTGYPLFAKWPGGISMG